MKNLTLGLISLFLLMVSCSQDDQYESNLSENAQLHTITNHYYGVKRSEQKNTKGVALRSNLWSNNTVITVKFLNEPATQKDKDIVVTYAKEWEKYAGISFKFVESGDAMIRIGFDWNEDRYVTWSYIGTDAKIVTNQNEATASFADFDYLTDAEKKGEVLRLFGQVLGLELEHRHLSFDAGWRDRVQSQWEGDISDIPWETLKKYVFDPLETTNAVMTEDYDPLSIMIWPFPRTVATNTERDFNLELSESDKAFIAKLYPKVEDGCIFEGKITENSLMYNTYYYKPGFKIVYHSQNTPLIIQWDNETKENLGTDFNGFVTYNGTTPRNGLTSIRIYGDAIGITEFHSNLIEMNDDYTTPRGIPLTGDYDFSKFINLKKLGFTCINSEDINLLNNPNLEELTLISEDYVWIGSEYFTWNGVEAYYDFTKLTKLKKLNLEGITNTDFSVNTELVELNLSYHNSEKSGYIFDFSQNKKLESLTISGETKCTRFDISQNTKLKNLELYLNNEFDNLDVSKNILLTRLRVYLDNPYQLDLSTNRTLEVVESFGPLNKLVLSTDKEQKLKTLGFWGPSITELNVSNSTYLEELSLWYCANLKEVDVSNNKFLKVISSSPYDGHINIIGWNKPTTKSMPALSAEKYSILEEYATKHNLKIAN
ncbi:MAG: hypothetical protein LBV71_18155 [Prevotella sp.]|jgi:hypothetical protein|nr:hypothetical protein [Prevotella sp.]